MTTDTILAQLRRLSEYFTSDGWQVIYSFIENLQEKLKQFNVAEDDQVTIFGGIQEYLDDFISDYKDHSKISFSDALGVIQDIGSPNEILQSMDLSIEKIQLKADRLVEIIPSESEESTRTISCTSCGWLNERDSIFCDKCGRKLVEVGKRVKEKPRFSLPQEIITSPFLAGIFLSYLVLVTCGMIILALTYSPFADPDLMYIPELYDKLNTISISMILPSIIVGLVVGLCINRFYSREFVLDRYEEHLIQLQTRFSFGMILSLISLWLILIYIPIQPTRNETFILIIALAFICLIVPFWIYRWNIAKKPSKTPYFTFLKSLRTLESYNMTKIRKYTIICSIAFFILITLVWAEIMHYSVLDIPGMTVFGLPAWIILILALVLFADGVFLMYYYSWNSINRFIDLI